MELVRVDHPLQKMPLEYIRSKATDGNNMKISLRNFLFPPVLRKLGLHSPLLAPSSSVPWNGHFELWLCCHSLVAFLSSKGKKPIANLGILKSNHETMRVERTHSRFHHHYVNLCPVGATTGSYASAAVSRMVVENAVVSEDRRIKSSKTG